jgi:hypothetical protein
MQGIGSKVRGQGVMKQLQVTYITAGGETESSKPSHHMFSSRMPA